MAIDAALPYAPTLYHSRRILTPLLRTLIRTLCALQCCPVERV
jgi:hypothetical protein